MTVLLFGFHGHEELVSRLCVEPRWRQGRVELRRFPDQECYVRVLDDVAGARCAIVASLDRPDEKLVPLVFLADTLRDLGARSVGLVAPYLAYMRQDKQFRPGEAVTSKTFARLVSQWFDWLVTVDPHLHRRQSLGEIYRIPCAAVRSTEALGAWIRANVEAPLLVGPDEESTQWVTALAGSIGAPDVVLRKERLSDRDVRITLPEVGQWTGHTPVLVDDIVSSARTMIEAVRALVPLGLNAPVCVCVHALFAGSAYEDLVAAGAARVASTNTVPHHSNCIDLSGLIEADMRRMAGP